MTTNQMMLAILAIDPNASLKFSDMTNQWYLDLSCEISDGFFLTGPTEHRDTPEAAIVALFKRITEIPPKQCISVYCGSDKPRQHYRWQGFMWKPTHLSTEHHEGHR